MQNEEQNLNEAQTGNSIKVAGLDDRNTKKATLQNGTYHLMIVAELKEGKFEFDVDESDCDRAVIYCL